MRLSETSEENVFREISVMVRDRHRFVVRTGPNLSAALAYLCI